MGEQFCKKESSASKFQSEASLMGIRGKVKADRVAPVMCFVPMTEFEEPTTKQPSGRLSLQMMSPGQSSKRFAYLTFAVWNLSASTHRYVSLSLLVSLSYH